MRELRERLRGESRLGALDLALRPGGVDADGREDVRDHPAFAGGALRGVGP
jgi:hypothetical protein